MDSSLILAQAIIDTMAILVPGLIAMIVIEWVIGLFRNDH